MDGVSSQLQATIDALTEDDGRGSPFYVGEAVLLSSVDASKHGAYKSRINAALVDITTSFVAMREFVEAEYVPAIETQRGSSIACVDLPDGKEAPPPTHTHHMHTHMHTHSDDASFNPRSS